jgi:hypothetical protein
MGACETTPATSHDREKASKRSPSRTTQPGRAPFLAPDHRPPLGSVKLVRPRLRLAGAPDSGRSSLTPARATAQPGSDEENAATAVPRPGDQRTGPPGQFSTAS